MGTIKTLLIYSEIPCQYPQYAILDGDYSHLSDITINSVESTESEQDMLGEFLFDEEGRMKIEMKPLTELKEVTEPMKVVTCGFYM